jgi:hypothetical protein
MSISITCVLARWRRLCVHGADPYLTEGFNSLKLWRVSCGSAVLYVIRSEVYLSISCLTVEGLEFDARVVCAGGQPVERG